MAKSNIYTKIMEAGIGNPDVTKYGAYGYTWNKDNYGNYTMTLAFDNIDSAMKAKNSIKNSTQSLDTENNTYTVSYPIDQSKIEAITKKEPGIKGEKITTTTVEKIPAQNVSALPDTYKQLRMQMAMGENKDFNIKSPRSTNPLVDVLGSFAEGVANVGLTKAYKDLSAKAGTKEFDTIIAPELEKTTGMKFTDEAGNYVSGPSYEINQKLADMPAFKEYIKQQWEAEKPKFTDQLSIQEWYQEKLQKFVSSLGQQGMSLGNNSTIEELKKYSTNK